MRIFRLINYERKSVGLLQKIQLDVGVDWMVWGIGAETNLKTGTGRARLGPLWLLYCHQTSRIPINWPRPDPLPPGPK